MGTPYPKTPMHRIDYTKLTPEQIQAKLNPVISRGPACASVPSDMFSGKTLKIVTDKGGPTLSYKFASATKLTVSENGSKPLSAGYGALTLDRIGFFAHLLPGSQRGFAVYVDPKTNLATVFELWFSGYKDNREVQRAVWTGYVDTGEAAPATRHVPTNRAEGKGYHWKQDTGAETLEFFPSMAYSHFVELSRQGGELGFCAPSDYIKVDDDFYLYTRTECEFSGTFTTYAIDLNRLEQVGLRLGFDEHDNLDFYIFRGRGTWLGQLAQFEKFGDTSGGAPPPRPGPGQSGNLDPHAKGARGIYRPLQTMPKMTKAEVDAAVARNTRVFETRVGAGSGAAGMAANGLSSVDALAGKTFTLRYDDGPVMDYKVAGADSLQWRKNGGPWVTARYQAWEPAPGVYLFGHLLEGEPNHDGHMVCADFEQGMVTCFQGTLNGPYFANEAVAHTMFGTIEAEGVTPPDYRRHHRTDELLGRAITWNYAPGLTSMHLYSTPNTVSWIIFTDTGAGGLEWSGPGDFVKIRDELYFAYWLEEACNGTLGTIVINLRTMHDAGIGYHCGAEGLSMSQVGAHARHAGRFDITRYFQVKK